jgi:hypothetical protein
MEVLCSKICHLQAPKYPHPTFRVTYLPSMNRSVHSHREYLGRHRKYMDHTWSVQLILLSSPKF